MTVAIPAARPLLTAHYEGPTGDKERRGTNVPALTYEVMKEGEEKRSAVALLSHHNRTHVRVRAHHSNKILLARNDSRQLYGSQTEGQGYAAAVLQSG